MWSNRFVSHLVSPILLSRSSHVHRFQFLSRSFGSIIETQILKYLLVSRAGIDSRVAVLTLNRPKALNALCDGLITELNETLLKLDQDKSVGSIIITGSERAFAAGADIKEMAPRTFPDTYSTNMLASWDNVTLINKPVIAAVSGFALGGGCELAMMCDIIIAADNAQFGQPEILLV